MVTTAVVQKFGSEALCGEFAGAETVLRFQSAAEELNALRHGCGVFDLGWRGKLVLSGDDRVRWLNGMITNNIRDLRLDYGNYSFVLNAQGHIQGDLLAFQRGEFFILEIEAGQIARIREFLEQFIIMDDVEIGDISSGLASLGVAGPHAVEVLNRAGLMPGDAQPGQVLDASWQGINFSLLRDPIEVRNWYEVWLAAENVEVFWNALMAAGASPVGAQALEWQRILLGLPRMGFDMGARELPQETGQVYALHHTKGCYIGQEIVERIHARGVQVPRRLTGLIVEGGAPARGTKVMAGDKEVGEITSSAEMVVDGVARTVALAYIRQKPAARNATQGANQGAIQDGSTSETLQVGASAARIAALPIQF